MHMPEICEFSLMHRNAVLFVQGAIKEMFLGSVTNYVTHHCKQPVLVMH